MSEESRRSLLQPLAVVEAALQQAESSRDMIGKASTALRKETANKLSTVERQGIHTPDNQEALKEALLDRRRCDLVSGMIDQQP